jgi:hypothetical protein
VERWATFDCYGTLIDWNGGIRRELARVFGEERADALLVRYHVLEAQLEADGKRTYREVLRESMRGLAAPPDEKDALARSLPNWEPFPEVPGALQEARDRGWKLAILSNTDRDFIEASQARLASPSSSRSSPLRSAPTSRPTATGNASSTKPKPLRTTRPCRREPLPRHRAGERAWPALDLDQPARRGTWAAAHPRAS